MDRRRVRRPPRPHPGDAGRRGAVHRRRPRVRLPVQRLRPHRLARARRRGGRLRVGDRARLHRGDLPRRHPGPPRFDVPARHRPRHRHLPARQLRAVLVCGRGEGQAGRHRGLAVDARARGGPGRALPDHDLHHPRVPAVPGRPIARRGRPQDHLQAGGRRPRRGHRPDERDPLLAERAPDQDHRPRTVLEAARGGAAGLGRHRPRRAPAVRRDQRDLLLLQHAVAGGRIRRGQVTVHQRRQRGWSTFSAPSSRSRSSTGSVANRCC